VYVFVDSDASDDEMAHTEGICQTCIDNACGPGKYESYGKNDEHLAEALMLEAWSLRSMDDEYMASNGDYCGRFDNYLLIIDDRGFVTYERYDTTEEAQKTYDRYFASGWGADEDDIYVSYEGARGVEIYCEGKQIPCRPNANHRISENRIDAAINLHMAKWGYYPNVWNSDRGGYSLRKIKVVSWLT
jgi:hypothetical protein